jgi:histidinol-phosphatase (PHP family)
VIVDYHMHLRRPKVDGAEPLALSADAVEPFVERARERGVDEICFTEHVYYFRQTRDIWFLPYHVERCVYDLDAYCGAVLEAKRRGLPVKLGLEVDYVGGRQDELAELLASYPWDLVLGSVHEVLDVVVDQAPGVWAERRVEDIWRDYVSHLCELAGSGHVDVLAHPDLAKIYGERPPVPVLTELHEHAAASIAAAGVAIEISTAGLRKPVGELYPDRGLLDACRRHGVAITTASDAHEPRLVGEDIEQAVELARAAGYETVSVFEERVRRQEPLGR